MINIKKIILFFYAFYILYTPNFSFISSLFSPSIVLLLLSLANIILLNRKLLSFVKKMKVVHIFICFIVLTAYVSIVNYINGFYIFDYVSNIVMCYNLINYISLFIWYEKIYKNNKFLEYIIFIGLSQAVISLLMVLIPGFKEFANMLYIEGENPSLNLLGITNHRIYGIGSGYTVALPFIQSFMGILSLYIVDKKMNIKYLFYSLFLAWSVLLNNRTGFIIYVLVLLMFVFKKLFTRISLNAVIMTFFIISLLILVPRFFQDSDKLQWLTTSIADVFNYILHGDRSDYTQSLTQDFLKFPQGLSLIFGTGHRAFGEKARYFLGFNSDIGYVNDLFKGGLIYVITLYLTIFINLSRRISNKFLLASIVLFMIIANYKGEIINGSAVMMLALITSIALNYYSKIMIVCKQKY
ncbi:hypothetical protein ODY52_02025 [Aerococcus sp. JJEM-2022c]|uniref:hypothetical protein n=1 Tax=Aerococcus sp. Group 2 TaxID=2976811 RepID=UPI00227B083C|nr:hypothetical protein [Aerococcus sp. Group 2]MCY3040740.1 hypothetical protein [Aerococcus sp. Group 2]